MDGVACLLFFLFFFCRPFGNLAGGDWNMNFMFCSQLEMSSWLKPPTRHVLFLFYFVRDTWDTVGF